jgi:3-oxoacyl-[acyl-carrier protein] reductase
MQSSKGEKVALITGASRGIGKSIAVNLAVSGYDLALNGTSPEESVKEVINECRKHGASTCYIQADISSSDGRKKIFDETKSFFGRIDILVNNAGVAPNERKDILNATEESYDRVMNINLKGPYFLTQLFAGWMIDLKKSLNEYNPMIINISSVSAYASSTGRGEYCISKAGMAMMTKLFADRLSEFGINVYEIRPGVIETDMTEKVKDKYDRLIAEGISPIKRWGMPDDVSKAVIAIVNNYFPFSTGEVINVDGGYHLRRL